ncbi:MAG: protein kinase [Polyangiaceae bacterium]
MPDPVQRTKSAESPVASLVAPTSKRNGTTPLGLTPGTLLAGRYQISRLVGSGGFGTVHEASHVTTERRVAVKVPHPSVAREPLFRARFLREGRLAARVGGEHVPQILDAGIDADLDLPFLVMELLVGEGLDVSLRRAGRFGTDDTVLYLGQVASALERAHACGIVHRDLKPSNLFVTQSADGRPLVKVLDFGIARMVDAATIGPGQAIGTPLYMAPEQFTQRALTPAADVYALGMLAYKFLVGVHYYRGAPRQCGGFFRLAKLLAAGPPEPASIRAAALGVPLPKGFDAWFASAAHPDPARRPASPSRAVEALALALAEGERGAIAGPLRAKRWATLPSRQAASVPSVSRSESSFAQHGDSGPCTTPSHELSRRQVRADASSPDVSRSEVRTNSTTPDVSPYELRNAPTQDVSRSEVRTNPPVVSDVANAARPFRSLRRSLRVASWLVAASAAGAAAVAGLRGFVPSQHPVMVRAHLETRPPRHAPVLLFPLVTESNGEPSAPTPPTVSAPSATTANLARALDRAAQRSAPRLESRDPVLALEPRTPAPTPVEVVTEPNRGADSDAPAPVKQEDTWWR